jgi:methanogenic corrinoid protein MtbC1
VVPADVDALRLLLSPGDDLQAGSAVGSPPDAEGGSQSMLDLIVEGDATRLGRRLRADMLRLGAERWVIEGVAPLVTEVGEAWARGDLTVASEHIATDVLRGLLADTWRPLSDSATGPVAVLAGLPGERHDLGLHMAAVVVASRGWRVMFVGADTPVDDIVAVGQKHAAVLVSCAAGGDPALTRSALRELSERLPHGHMVVGGAGAPAGAGPLRLDGLAGLGRWLAGLK